LSKSERIWFRIWFVILALLTIGSGIYLGAVYWLQYWHDQPLMNLDFPLILGTTESLEYDLRLRNTGNYVISISDVRLEGDAFTWAPGAWSVESEAGDKRILPFAKASQDAILHLNLRGQIAPQHTTIIIVEYKYGWFRRSIELEIKTELPQ